MEVFFLSLENIIYTIKVILIIFLLFRFIPKDEIRKAHVAYLFTQIITWPMGLIVANYKLIEYPIRLFTYANKANFLFEYFYLPAICALFVVNYPERKGILARFRYYFYYCSTLTICEVIEERYLSVLIYIHWNWVITWITLFSTFYIVTKYTQWFIKKQRC